MLKKSAWRLLTSLCMSVMAARTVAAGDTRVLIWDEQQPEQKSAYNKFLGETIGEWLSKQPGFQVRYGYLAMQSYGLDDASLDNTDVIVWWGHRKHAAVSPERAEAVTKRVLEGRLGFIGMHSSIHARPFLRLMEERAKQDALNQIPAEKRQHAQFEFLPSPPRGVAFEPQIDWQDSLCKLMRPSGWIAKWRADAKPGHIQTLLPEHPIAKGLPSRWSIPQTEMYDEPFHVPEPDSVIFEETWESGEHFRSGCTWAVGRGYVFYFRPGHETYPVFRQEENLRVIENAASWLIHNR